VDSVSQTRILRLPVRPGLKTGSTLRYKNINTQDGMPQEMHFVVKQKPHSLFTRDGDDLHLELEIDLLESLCGWTRLITKIDGSRMKLRKRIPTQPGSSDTYPNFGMPRSRDDQRGNLIVKYAVKYPTSFTAAQRASLRETLENGGRMR